MNTTLKLSLKKYNGKTNIENCFYTSPLKIGTPKSEDDRSKFVLMMASSGVLKGDSFNYDITCGADTKSILLEQSYTKIFDTGDGCANKTMNIHINSNVSLYYRPCPVIPFENSSYKSVTNIYCQINSEILWTDIFSIGRVGMGERFMFNRYQSKVNLYVDNKIAFLDHAKYEPEKNDLTNMIFFGQYTHTGTLYYYGAEDKIQKILNYHNDDERIVFGVSRSVSGVCLRAMAYTAQDIEKLFENIIKIF